MKKKSTRAVSAAERSVKGTRKQRQQHTTDPMQKSTKGGRQRAGGDGKGEESVDPTDRPQCTGTKPNGMRCKRPPVRGGERCQKHGGEAKRTNAQKRAALNAAVSGSEKVTCTAVKRNGERCANPPVRGTYVCRMHGAGAPQVKAKANQRLIEMVIPAMRELRRVLDSKTASDADKLKAVHMVLQRTGFNERHAIDIGLREPTPFDDLATSGFVILRGEDNILDRDEAQALPSGGGGELTDDDLDALLTHRERTKAQETQSRLDHGDHDVVPGDVVSPDESNLFGYERSREQRYRDSGASELDPRGTRRGEGPFAAYERRVREGVEGAE